jgi:TRAP-type C4-dicarboxylate transport system substrate-binding protein
VKILNRPVLGLALVSLLSASAAGAVVEVKSGSVAPEGTPWEEWLKDVQKRITKESNGEIKMKLYLAGKKGGEREMIEDTKAGRLQMFGGSVGALAAKYVPELNVFELPFLFESNEEVDFVLNALRPDVKKLLLQRGFVMGMWAQNGWHGYAVKGKCLKSPADMTGLKMRSQESKIHTQTYKAFGASPVELPVPEVLSSLQTGVVDGFSNTPLFSFATSWYQGVTHYTYTQHIFQPALIVYSKKWFDKQDKKHQAILVKTDEEKSGMQAVRDLTAPLLDNFTHAGIEVCKLDAAGKKAFQDKAKSVWDEFAKRGKGNKKILDAVLKAKKDFAKKG